MAENESITPEKQLLKLIENPKTKEVRRQSTKRATGKWFSFGAFQGRLAFWKGFSSKKVSSLKKGAKSPSGIRQLNLGLKVLALCLGGYLIYSVVDNASALEKASNLIIDKGKRLPVVEEEVSSIKGLSYYLDRVNARDIFNFEEIKQEDVAKPVVKTAPRPEKVSAVAQDYSLVGIAWSKNPEAMIENKKLTRTYFVKRGDVVDEGVKVVAIFRDRVVMNVGDEEFELS